MTAKLCATSEPLWRCIRPSDAERGFPTPRRALMRALRRRRLLSMIAVSAALAVVAAMFAAPPAYAFKPYTHVQTGTDARSDAIDDGMVTINGREYPVNPAVVTALRDWPSYYN